MPTKVIDLENHFAIKEVLEYAATRNDYPYYRADQGLWCTEGGLLPIAKSVPAYHPPVSAYDEFTNIDEMRLKYMDEAGVTTACISAYSVIEGLPREEAIEYARKTNDAIAAASKKYPGRILGAIALPTVFVDDAIEELERAKKLGLKFWQTHSNYGKEHLYDAKFEPLLAKCAELNVPFYLHPEYTSEKYLTDSGFAFASAGFAFSVDVMKTATRIIMNGTFDRHPDLKMILGHMAEYFPYTIGRMDNRFGLMPDLDPFIKMKHDFTYYFKNKNIMMTTSGIFEMPVLKCAMETIGVDNIMFGSDYPFELVDKSVDFIKNAPISDEDKEKILYKNAERLILEQ